MKDYKKLFEEYLNSYMFPDSMLNIIKYVMYDSGNRIRPQLALAWCEACGGEITSAMPFALAVECIHTMSLIHDDLPCMDNETMRRGKLCLHKTEGEAVAVLCGDLLLSLAFNIITKCDISEEQRIKAISVLSETACNMANGQYIELTADPNTIEEWTEVHKGKTAGLLEAACMLGVIAANGTELQFNKAMLYGRSIGLGYQLIDDIRDHDGISNKISNDISNQLIQGYIHNCEVNNGTNASAFLTKFAKAVLT